MFHSTYVTISVTTHSFNCVRVCQIYVDLYFNRVVKSFNILISEKSTWSKKSECVNIFILQQKQERVCC